jgi:hypothetical protein
MTPYFEPRFLACLLLRAPGTALAWSITRGFAPPYGLNRLHSVQIEGMLLNKIEDADPAQRGLARAGLRMWQRLWDEGVFEVRLPDWEAALVLSLQINRRAKRQVARPTACLHAAIAANGGMSHFLSFEPRAREAAAWCGLKLLPERL